MLRVEDEGEKGWTGEGDERWKELVKEKRRCKERYENGQEGW